MSTKGKIDMTRGSVAKNVLLFALPICAGNILQQLYATVDTLVIGNFCGSTSLAAVGTSTQPVEILLCVFVGIGTAVSILVSQFTGGGEGDKLRDMIATAITFLYLCTVPLTILGQFVGPVILEFMQVPADAWPLANSYLRIIIFGILSNLGYNMNAGILRGLGDSRASLIFLVISSCVNISLDLLFVAVLGMDVAGAALATIIAMYCSWFCSIFYIKKKYPEIGFTVLPRRMNREMLIRIVKIGLPLGLNGSLYSIGHVALQVMINMQGSVFIAACAVGSKINGIANVAINSLSSAATTFAGQNLGAQNYRFLKRGGIEIPLFSGLITAAAGMIVTLNCRPLLGLFTQDAEVLEVAARYIQIVLPFMWTYAVLNSISNFMNGMGLVRYTMVVSLLMLWAVRIPGGWLIARYIDGAYLMACYPLSFATGMVCMLGYYLTGSWKHICREAALQKTMAQPGAYDRLRSRQS